MSYLLIFHLSLSITWVGLTVDDWDYPVEYEVDGQASQAKIKVQK